jgi:hypothetical protein
VNATIRTLDDSEIDFVAGGIIDGCLTMYPWDWPLKSWEDPASLPQTKTIFL